jgi:hypothetical protein
MICIVKGFTSPDVHSAVCFSVDSSACIHRNMQALFACSNMEPAARTCFCPVHAVPGSSSCTNLLSSVPAALGANNRTPMRGRGQATCCLTGRVAWIASSEWRQGTFGRGVRPASAWCTAARTLASGPRARWVAEKGVAGLAQWRHKYRGTAAV